MVPKQETKRNTRVCFFGLFFSLEGIHTHTSSRRFESSPSFSSGSPLPRSDSFFRDSGGVENRENGPNFLRLLRWQFFKEINRHRVGSVGEVYVQRGALGKRKKKNERRKKNVVYGAGGAGGETPGERERVLRGGVGGTGKADSHATLSVSGEGAL